MNFGTHKKKLVESLQFALDKDKPGIISDLVPILSNARTLFKSQMYDFWLRQIDSIEIDEIAMTYFGVSEAKRFLSNASNLDKNSLSQAIAYICEAVLTYCKPSRCN